MMSTAVQNISAPPIITKPARARFMGKNVWALGDQILISGSNFLTMVLLARSLGPSMFGTFTLAYSALLLSNILQSTLITQPHNVLASTRGGPAYGRFTYTMGVAQIGLAIIEAIIAGAVAWWAYAHHLPVAPILLALIPAIVGWQLQEFVRRVLYTESRFSAAFFNDCISYGGQTLLIIALWANGTLRGDLAFYALAATSLLAAAIGIWQIRGSLSLKFDHGAMHESWEFGKWLTGGELLQWGCSLQMYLYLAAIILGTAAAGELRAAQILFGPTRVLAFYLGSVLPMRFARALASGGNAAVHHQLVDAARRVLPWLGAYAVLVAVFAHPLLRLMYRDSYAGDASVLVIYSAAAFVDYVQVLITSALSAKRLTRSIFNGQLCGLMVTALMSWWIIRLFGVAGVPVALGVSTTLITIMFWRAYKKSMDATIATASIDELPTEMAGIEAAEAQLPEHRQARVELLQRVLGALKSNNIPFCITHGYAGLEQSVTSDVDCIIPARYTASELVKILRVPQADGTAARVVQWMADRAQFIVIADDIDRSPAMVQLHVSPDFELDGHVFFSADEIMASRRPHGEFFVPSPEIEFACVLLNRITKGKFAITHAARLSMLFAQAPAECEQQIRRFWSSANATLLLNAVRGDNWEPVRAAIAQLSTDAHRRVAAKQLPAIAGRKLAAAARRVSRWVKPKNGFHIVFLGPDGVGKSTIIEHVRDAIAPAFLSNSYHTFAPSLIPHKFQPEKPTPHAFPPRSYPASLVKAAWWSICYTAGYMVTIHPDRARGGFAMNHRYLLDAIVDPKRYRYSGQTGLLRAIWFVAPKPDLVILLDAPAEVIQARKKEVAFEETARQRSEYRALLANMKYGRIINAARPIDEVVAEVNGTILEMLAARVERQIGKGAGK